MADHLKRADFSAAIGRKRKAMADVEDAHARFSRGVARRNLRYGQSRYSRRSLGSFWGGTPVIPVEINPAPQFEIDEGEKMIGVIAGLRAMRGDDFIHPRGIEEAAAADLRFTERVADEAFEIPAEPRAHGSAEAALFAMQNFVRHERLEYFLEQIFHGQAAHFQIRRHARCHFDQFVIYERSATFERRGHAHSIG